MGTGATWLAVAPEQRFQVRLVASATLIRGVSAGLAVFEPRQASPRAACNCSSGWRYACEDPQDAYYRQVRSDARLAPLFSLEPHRIATYAAFQDHLRSLFAHGEPTRRVSRFGSGGYDVLEMLDDAAAGSGFLCRDISKMLAQVIQAAGGYARLVSLADASGSGHVVIEAWVEDVDGWVVFDPDYDAYFTDATGRALNALELHELHRAGRYDEVTARVGASPNAVYRPELHASLLAHYDSVAWNARASWRAEPLPRWHPDRHPVRTVSAWASASSAFPAFSVHDHVSDASEIYFTPCRPSGARMASSRVAGPLAAKTDG